MCKSLPWLLLCALGALQAAEPVPDPTRPPLPSAQTTSSGPAAGLPRLQSTLIGPGRREAVIDGQWLREGDRLGSARIQRILPGRVILRGETGEIELTLSFVAALPGVSR